MLRFLSPLCDGALRAVGQLRSSQHCV